MATAMPALARAEAGARARRAGAQRAIDTRQGRERGEGEEQPHARKHREGGERATAELVLHVLLQQGVAGHPGAARRTRRARRSTTAASAKVGIAASTNSVAAAATSDSGKTRPRSISRATWFALAIPSPIPTPNDVTMNPQPASPAPRVSTTKIGAERQHGADRGERDHDPGRHRRRDRVLAEEPDPVDDVAPDRARSPDRPVSIAGDGGIGTRLIIAAENRNVAASRNSGTRLVAPLEDRDRVTEQRVQRRPAP